MASPNSSSNTMEPPSKKQKFSTSTSTTSPSSDPVNNRNSMVSQPQSTEENTEKMDEFTTRVVISDNGFQPDREIAVGIVCFVNNENPGFSGTLKQRYTDFQVNEIEEDGTVVHLTDDKAPASQSVKKPATHPGQPKSTAIASAPKDEKENAAPESVVSTAATEDTSKADSVKGSKSAAPASFSSVVDKTEEGTVELKDGKDAAVPGTKTAERPTTPTKNSNEMLASSISALVSPKGSPNGSVAGEIGTQPLSPETDRLLSWHLGAELKDQVVDLDKKIRAKPNAKPNTFDTLTSKPMERQIRGIVHGHIRRIFDGRLATVADEDTGGIQIYASGAGSSKNTWNNPRPQNPRQQQPRGQPTGKLGWQDAGGEYLHFSLYKENKDTMEVIGYLAFKLNVKPRDFAFAGTKDRRAVTVQRVSVYRQEAKRLANLNKELRGARIGNFKYEKHGLELGELRGNQFHITLRDCHFGDDAAMENQARLDHGTKVVGLAVKHLQQHGFINYYGLQRFGTFGIGTDEIGLKILRGDFKGAVDAILTFNEESARNQETANHRYGDRISRDDYYRAKAIQVFRNGGNFQAIVRELPKKFSAESQVMQRLTQRNRKADYEGALMAVNRNLRSMYVHAYQSLVWNVVASERWNRFGSKVIKGDLILINSKAAVEDEVDESGEVVIHAAADDSAVTRDDFFQRARALTAEEAESGQFTIFDIVLPTPGFDVNYPDNEIGDFYKEFMASERGGGLDPANMRRTNKDFSLSGSYRKLLGQLGGDCTFELKLYAGDQEQLVETDLEKLLKSRGDKPQDQNNRPSIHPNDRQHNNAQGKNASRGVAHTKSTDTRQDVVKIKDQYQGTAALNAWKNLPTKLAADAKVDLAAAQLDRAERKVSGPKEEKSPVIKETWIQTSPEDFTKRTGVKSTTIIGEEEPKATSAPHSPALKPETETAPVFSKVEKIEAAQFPSSPVIKAEEQLTTLVPKAPASSSAMDLDVKESASSEGVAKRSADEISTAPSSPSLVSKELAKEEPVPNKIAVVVKFSLLSSQYATMALRELMKAGGVKTYKPDFSGGR